MSPESLLVRDAVVSALRESPKEPVWEWAAENVRFTPDMASDEVAYRPELTPWTKEWQELARQPDVVEGIAMKSSQTGLSQGCLNVLAWKPRHAPGRSLYAINSDKKAKDVAGNRLAPLFQGSEVDTGNGDDISSLRIRLRNMEIVVSGVGAPTPFRETFYSVAVLDEVEDHRVFPDGTTLDLVRSRFATVSDATLYALSKPQQIGGPIHVAYLRGSQEFWAVPCPRCGEFIELLFEFLRFSHCRDLVGGWDLDRVIAETFYECQKCGGKIKHHEKSALVNAGEWREREDRWTLEGRTIKRKPGVRSFHISDLYSLFHSGHWGRLAEKFLRAYKLEPSVTAQNDFRTNHLGLPFESQAMAMADDAILNLRGGIVEETETGSRIRHGERFGICFEDHQRINDLPVEPALILITADVQGDAIKFIVYARARDGQAWLIEYGWCNDETAFLNMLKDRRYTWKGRNYRIWGGLIDCGFRTRHIYKVCLQAQRNGTQLHPARGAGHSNEFFGKNVRETQDYPEEGGIITVYRFHDHALKSDFYLGRIGRRDAPRLWLPDPVPAAIVTEWTSEKLVAERVSGRTVQKWKHDTQKGPNDFGDCGKMQELAWQLFGQGFRSL